MSTSASSTANETITVKEAFDYASGEPCAACFWFAVVVLISIVFVVVFLYVFGRDRLWPVEEEPRDLTKLRRHCDDVWLQSNLSRAIADYWAQDSTEDANINEEVEIQMSMVEDKSQNSELENFNALLELRRKNFIRTTRRNALKNQLLKEESEWSVTLYDIKDDDQLDAETLLAKLVFVLPRPFVPKSPSKNYLKEEVRIALLTMLRKIHFEGYDVHVAALVQSAVVVWNDGVTVQIGDKPFYPSFPLLSFAEVQKAVQMPENVEEEMERLKEAEPELPYKISYEDVLSLEASIDRRARERRQRLDKMKQNKWSMHLAKRLVDALTEPRVFETLGMMEQTREEKVLEDNKNLHELSPEKEKQAQSEQDTNKSLKIAEGDGS